MARDEQDREDLLREATALVERVELDVMGEPASVVAGFRRDGAVSLYFGPDPVYQFNARGELRRGFVGGLLYKADQNRLASLRRARASGQSVLLRKDLDDAKTAFFLAAMTERLSSLREALQQGRYRENGRVPSNADVTQRVVAWLEEFSGIRSLAQTPHAR